MTNAITTGSSAVSKHGTILIGWSFKRNERLNSSVNLNSHSCKDGSKFDQITGTSL